jgi:hypothetical protein
MDPVQRRNASAQEVAAERSALAVGRGEKTLEEHELYVEALFVGTNAPPRQRNAWRTVAIALGVAVFGMVAGLVAFAALGPSEHGSGAGGDAQAVTPNGPDQDPPSDEARLETAVKRARQAYFAATMVTPSERRRKPEVTGGYCQRPIPGRTLLDDAYMCATWERSLHDIPPGVDLPPPPPQELSVNWKVTLDARSCWKATPMDVTQGGGLDLEELTGCLRR